MIVAIALTTSMALQASLPDPPAMPKRSISKSEKPLPGKTIDLYGDGKYALFIPDKWEATTDVPLTLHFHGASWFAIEEHLRRGLKEPLLAVYLGEGSSVYANAFVDPDSWPKLLSHVAGQLAEGSTVRRVDVTSFSAGYGAVRELLKQTAPPTIIRRIVLADSMYASFTSDADKSPLQSQIDPYVGFAKQAMRGEKGFAVTFSEVPTGTYANSAACARSLVQAVGGSLNGVSAGSLPATRDPDFPLKLRFDKGSFHVWGYGGTDAQAHMTHPRHIADIWRAAFGSD
jgi:hypothetical protein